MLHSSAIITSSLSSNVFSLTQRKEPKSKILLNTHGLNANRFFWSQTNYTPKKEPFIVALPSKVANSSIFKSRTKWFSLIAKKQSTSQAWNNFLRPKIERTIISGKWKGILMKVRALRTIIRGALSWKNRIQSIVRRIKIWHYRSLLVPQDYLFPNKNWYVHRNSSKLWKVWEIS